MQLQQQYLALQAKLDGAHDDRLAGRITDELWLRKSVEGRRTGPDPSGVDTRVQRAPPSTRPPARAPAQAARFRDADRSLDAFNFDFNKKMNRALIHELATGRFVGQREDALFLGPPGTGKSHLAQAIGRAVIQQGYRVLYREAHRLLEELADATLDGTRKAFLADLAAVPLLIIDDLGMRKLPHTAAEDLLEVIMRRYERASTLLTSTDRSTTGARC